MIGVRTFSVLTLAAAMMTPPAVSEGPILPADVVGDWRFQTERDYNDGRCTMSGAMTITGTNTADAYSCVFTAEETCMAIMLTQPEPGTADAPSYQEVERTFVSEQTCTAIVRGATLQIKSQLVSVEPNTSTYLPDNFTLVAPQADVMRGRLWFSRTVAPVRFDRDAQAVS